MNRCTQLGHQCSGLLTVTYRGLLFLFLGGLNLSAISDLSYFYYIFYITVAYLKRIYCTKIPLDATASILDSTACHFSGVIMFSKRLFNARNFDLVGFLWRLLCFLVVPLKFGGSARFPCRHVVYFLGGHLLDTGTAWQAWCWRLLEMVQLLDDGRPCMGGSVI